MAESQIGERGATRHEGPHTCFHNFLAYVRHVGIVNEFSFHHFSTSCNAL